MLFYRQTLFFSFIFFHQITAINLGVASPYICEAKCDDMQYKRKQSLIFILIKKSNLESAPLLENRMLFGEKIFMFVYILHKTHNYVLNIL